MNGIVLFKERRRQEIYKDAVKPIVNVVYNEIYIYVWFICIYNVFLIFIILTNLYYLYKLSNSSVYKINPIAVVNAAQPRIYTLSLAHSPTHPLPTYIKC
jgi:hypothetical protein